MGEGRRVEESRGAVIGRDQQPSEHQLSTPVDAVVPAAWLVEYGDGSVGLAVNEEEAAEMLYEARTGAKLTPLFRGITEAELTAAIKNDPRPHGAVLWNVWAKEVGRKGRWEDQSMMIAMAFQRTAIGFLRAMDWFEQAATVAYRENTEREPPTP